MSQNHPQGHGRPHTAAHPGRNIRHVRRGFHHRLRWWRRRRRRALTAHQHRQEQQRGERHRSTNTSPPLLASDGWDLLHPLACRPSHELCRAAQLLLAPAQLMPKLPGGHSVSLHPKTSEPFASRHSTGSSTIGVKTDGASGSGGLKGHGSGSAGARRMLPAKVERVGDSARAFPLTESSRWLRPSRIDRRRAALRARPDPR